MSTKPGEAQFNFFDGQLDDQHRVRPGDLLFAWSGTPGTSFGAFVWKGPEAALNQHIFNIRFDRLAINASYFAHALNERVRGFIEQAQGGVGLAHITKSKFLASTVPLAPFDEQRRVVEALDSYFSRLDEAVTLLERVQRNLARYRAAVLTAAVQGRLVPTEAELARREGRDYEPASVLLERILAERRRRWEEAELAKMQAGGRPPRDDRRKQRYEEPPFPDSDDLPELPEGWCWANLALLKEFSLYGPRFSSDDYAIDGRLVLRTSDISASGRVNLATAPRLRLDDEEFDKYRVEVGDLLVTRTGSLGTLAVFNDTVDAIPGAYLIQFRLAAPLDTSWFCFYFLKSPTGQARLRGGGAGVGRPNLNAPTIEAIVFGLPPLAEQARILPEVERLLSVADALQCEIASNLTRCAGLRQLVLRWAFEGRLADHDATDEPASALLERIKAERAVKEDKAGRAHRPTPGRRATA